MSILDKIRGIATEPQQIEDDVMEEVWEYKNGKLVLIKTKVVITDDNAEEGQ